MDYKKGDLEKKVEFEKLLTDRSSERTTSKVLENLKDKRKIIIGNLPTTRREISSVEIGGLDILTIYKDGMALQRTGRFPNGNGNSFYYFLHGNGEMTAYHLGSIDVSYSPTDV